jgi:hypothetical protein
MIVSVARRGHVDPRASTTPGCCDSSNGAGSAGSPTERDARAANLVDALDLSNRSLVAPSYAVDPAAAPTLCAPFEADK